MDVLGDRLLIADGFCPVLLLPLSEKDSELLLLPLPEREWSLSSLVSVLLFPFFELCFEDILDREVIMVDSEFSIFLDKNHEFNVDKISKLCFSLRQLPSAFHNFLQVVYVLMTM